MNQNIVTTTRLVPPAPTFSPLMLADRLIGLAQEADRAGMNGPAARLIVLAYSVLEGDSPRHH